MFFNTVYIHFLRTNLLPLEVVEDEANVIAVDEVCVSPSNDICNLNVIYIN